LAEEYPVAEEQLEKYQLIDPKDVLKTIQFKPLTPKSELSSIASEIGSSSARLT
jgi:hypothetical protein